MRSNFQYDAPRIGLTPDLNGEYRIGQSEMALIDAYRDREARNREMMGHHHFDDEEDDE